MENEPFWLGVGHQRALAILPMITGTISGLSSLFVIRFITGEREHFKKPYYRLIFGLSIMDVLFSFNAALSTLVLPSDTPDVQYAHGTTFTCEVSGFVWQVGQGTVFYSACLSFFYLLTIRFGIKEETIEHYIEPWLHLVSVGWPLALAIVGLSKNYFNALGGGLGWCYFNDYPASCSTSDTVECIRGKNADSFPWLTPTFLLNFMIILLCMGFIIWRVWSQERVIVQRTDHSYKARNTKRASVQALLYIGAFLISFGWAFVLNALPAVRGTSTRGKGGAILFLVYMFKGMVPLQGFWNCIIFNRPRIIAARKAGKPRQFMRYIRVIVSHNQHSVAMDADVDANIRDDSGMDDAMLISSGESRRASELVTKWCVDNVVPEQDAKISRASDGTEDSTIGGNKKSGPFDHETTNQRSAREFVTSVEETI